MKKLYIVLASFFAFLLIGCNGQNEDNAQNKPQVVATIELSLLDSEGNLKQSFVKSESIIIQAKVTDKNNKPITRKKVDFFAPIGSLSVASKLTDANGLAIVSISNNSFALGAATANASVGEISSQNIDYEFTESDAAAALPKLTTVMKLNDVTVNQFKVDQEVQISSTLTDNNGKGIANKIITFSANVGTFNATTALTNNQGIATVTLTDNNNAIGAGILTSSYALDENTNISSTFNYQILPADALINSNIRLGYFDKNNVFIEGKIELSVADKRISAGGTLGLSVDLVDENGVLITIPTPVTFTSNCVQNNNANIDGSVLSINGTARATFADVDCAGATGTDDVLIANVIVNTISSSANETITISGEQLGSIEFVSSEPTSIILKGTGGQNKQETSTLTFRVKSQLGNILAQQEVNFALSTSIGDIKLSRASGFTNSQGLITTQVISGTVPTAVRVTASASMVFNNETITVQSQSDLLSINTGLAEQRSMSISASALNPEAHNIDDATSTISVRLSDNFHNPVPDGTTVNFTTEGGDIVPSCSTINGSCSVIWTSSEPRVADHRVTILATALGHETFFDTNGNNIFDDADGSPIINASDCNNATINAGFSNCPAQPSGFLDMSEAWRDDNENSTYDSGETFIDFNNDKAFTPADAKFNGPQCQGAKCGADALHVRKAIRLVMASSAAEFRLTNNTGSIVYQDSLTGASIALSDVPNGGSQKFIFSFADTANQTLPLGTSVTISISAGSLQGLTNFTVANNNRSGLSQMGFFVIQTAGDPAQAAVLTMTITSPSGVVTSTSRNINLL